MPGVPVVQQCDGREAGPRSPSAIPRARPMQDRPKVCADCGRARVSPMPGPGTGDTPRFAVMAIETPAIRAMLASYRDAVGTVAAHAARSHGHLARAPDGYVAPRHASNVPLVEASSPRGSRGRRRERSTLSAMVDAGPAPIENSTGSPLRARSARRSSASTITLPGGSARSLASSNPRPARNTACPRAPSRCATSSRRTWARWSCSSAISGRTAYTPGCAGSPDEHGRPQPACGIRDEPHPGGRLREEVIEAAACPRGAPSDRNHHRDHDNAERETVHGGSYRPDRGDREHDRARDEEGRGDAPATAKACGRSGEADDWRSASWPAAKAEVIAAISRVPYRAADDPPRFPGPVKRRRHGVLRRRRRHRRRASPACCRTTRRPTPIAITPWAAAHARRGFDARYDTTSVEHAAASPDTGHSRADLRGIVQHALGEQREVGRGDDAAQSGTRNSTTTRSQRRGRAAPLLRRLRRERRSRRQRRHARTAATAAAAAQRAIPRASPTAGRAPQGRARREGDANSHAGDTPPPPSGRAVALGQLRAAPTRRCR